MLITVFGLLGGVALLLYGMQVATEGLQLAAGPHLKAYLRRATGNPISGLLSGGVLAAVLQSSGATMVMVIGLVGAGLMSLPQTIGIILGANIGGTLTAQLIAFRVTEYAPLLIALGYLVGRFSKSRVIRNLAKSVLGFGLIFLALSTLSHTLSPLEQMTGMKGALAALSKEPVMVLILAAALTALLNSSTAVIGLAIAMAADGIIDLKLALPLVLGANVGTCFTSIVASIGSPPEARRVAFLHTSFKVLGVMVAFPLIGPVESLFPISSDDLPRQIANAHTLFNVGLSVMILPFGGLATRLATHLIPDDPDEEYGFRVRYLDERVLETPLIALGNAQRELRRMADRVQEMLDLSMSVFLKPDEALLEKLNRREQEVDILSRAIINYLSILGQSPLSGDEAKKATGLLYIVNDLEHIGDTIARLGKLGRKKMENGLMFSKEGVQELIVMYDAVKQILERAILAFLTSDAAMAQQVIEDSFRIPRMERDLRQSHLARLWAGQKTTRDTSAIHLDVINSLQRVNDHAAGIAKTVLGEL